jgi:predicted restriction endonuclease
MSRNRDTESDRRETRRMIAEPYQQSGGKNWLGHRDGTGAAAVDHLLLEGASEDELIKTGRTTVQSFHTHLKHLEESHDLRSIQGSDGRFRFDREHLGLPEPPSDAPITLPEEIADTDGLPEGAVRNIAVNAYERNPEARRQCLAHYGHACVACGFDFGATYGAFAERYIHVHHLTPMSQIRKAYRINPISDLRPVCPNCHAMIHFGGICRSIDEIKRAIRAMI